MQYFPNIILLMQKKIIIFQNFPCISSSFSAKNSLKTQKRTKKLVGRGKKYWIEYNLFRSRSRDFVKVLLEFKLAINPIFPYKTKLIWKNLNSVWNLKINPEHPFNGRRLACTCERSARLVPFLGMLPSRSLFPACMILLLSCMMRCLFWMLPNRNYPNDARDVPLLNFHPRCSFPW